MATDEELVNAARSVMSLGMAATTPDGTRLLTPEAVLSAYKSGDGRVTWYSSASAIETTRKAREQASATVLRPTTTG